MAIFNKRSGKAGRRRWENKKRRKRAERWQIIASVPKLGTDAALCLWLWEECVCDHRNSIREQVHLFFFFYSFNRKTEGEKCRRGFPFFFMRWSCWAVTRTHHTHRIQCAPFPPSASSIPGSLPLMCQFLPVINLSARLPERINELSLVQVLQCTRLGPPDWNPLLHQYQCSISRCELDFLAISVKIIICGAPERKAAAVC